MGLSYAFISHTMQLVIMAVMGFISIPVLAKERNKAVSSIKLSEERRKENFKLMIFKAVLLKLVFYQSK